MTIEEAKEKFPACCLSAYENLVSDNGAESIKAMIDATEHELILYSEDQDGCITAKERRLCCEFLRFLIRNGVYQIEE